jgi:hypothetical protein
MSRPCAREDVHVYRLDVRPEDARLLLLRYLQEINQLREHPAWYTALTDKCTTAIQRLAMAGEPGPGGAGSSS